MKFIYWREHKFYFRLNKSRHRIKFIDHNRLILRGVMVKAMDCGIVVREFVLQSRYYVHFRKNTPGKA